MHIHLSSVYHFTSVQGGNERYTSLLAHGLKKVGIEVTYLSSSIPPTHSEYTYTKLPVYHLLNKPLPTPDWLTTIKPLPQLFHATGSGLPLLFLARAYQKGGLPTLLTFQGPSHPQTFMHQLGSKLEHTLINHYIDVLITTSPGNQKYLKLHFPHKPIHIIPLCFTPLVSATTSSKKASQLSKSPFNLLLVANLDPHHYYKGVSVALKAIQSLPHSFHLHIVGNGSLLSKYKQVSSNLGITRRVTFHGTVSDAGLHQLYARSNVYIQPSTSSSEGFGLSLIDAMNYHLPVITTTTIGIAPWLKVKGLASLIPPNNSPALAHAITQTAASTNAPQINRAFSFAQSLTSEKMVQATLNLYRQYSQ
jgi:glycosyltransferase involved in cell wall biosynthesis